MVSRKRILMALAVAPVLTAFLTFPVASQAAGKHVKCEVTNKEGKKETKTVKNADECTKMGGTVVTAKGKEVKK